MSSHTSWKCPGCGKHVTKIVGGKQRRHLEGQRGGVDGYIDRIVSGSLNQLCNKCWESWDYR